MKLYLSGWESDLVERALKEVNCTNQRDKEQVDKILERIENCKSLQKHH